MKVHGQNQLHASFSFWSLKVLYALLACPGMPDPTHVKLHQQFVALIDMHLNTKNQLYTSISFWDIKV